MPTTVVDEKSPASIIREWLSSRLLYNDRIPHSGGKKEKVEPLSNKHPTIHDQGQCSLVDSEDQSCDSFVSERLSSFTQEGLGWSLVRW